MPADAKTLNPTLKDNGMILNGQGIYIGTWWDNSLPPASAGSARRNVGACIAEGKRGNGFVLPDLEADSHEEMRRKIAEHWGPILLPLNKPEWGTLRVELGYARYALFMRSNSIAGYLQDEDEQAHADLARRVADSLESIARKLRSAADAVPEEKS